MTGAVVTDVFAMTLCQCKCDLRNTFIQAVGKLFDQIRSKQCCLPNWGFIHNTSISS